MPDTDPTAQLLLLLADEGALQVLLLLALLGLTICTAALCFLTVRIRAQHRLIANMAQRMEDLHNEVCSYGQSLIALRTLLSGMEGRISEFTDRNLEIQSQFAFNRSFEEASRLVRDGGTVESLVADCGLSDAEAALMIRLHGTDGQKPRRQWRQVPAELRAGSEDPPVSEEIRLREAMSAARGQSR